MSQMLEVVPWPCGVAHIHGNVRVGPERPVADLDRMKSTVVSVDAVLRTRTECSR
jgi:hypothetical protein